MHLLKVYAKGTRRGALRRFARWAVEPSLRFDVVRHVVRSERWAGAPLRIVVISDLHAQVPVMGLERVARIVARANALGADIMLLPGDVSFGLKRMPRRPHPEEVVQVLARLEAPLGRYAVLGNHDWREDYAALRDQPHLPRIGRALEAAGIPVLENRAVRIERAGGAFWLAGMGTERIFGEGRLDPGTADLDATLAAIRGDDPAILMMHEPDPFPQVPERIALSVCGHTHGGQLTAFGRALVVPSRHGTRYAYGHIREGGRDLVVSGGLGCSTIPLRLGRMPEITVVELSSA
ncbi:metallophosphoesterase [Pontivivens ytuae]|uniref:Metallophosphoesterase n=1 Tax=Pontivivens ytuae TaxID=2789856 RepID=A0A7S9QDF6_9RHOB|nr:metallophosphoesterase [Pontivivens ytuae]QPH54337.1 metallophosphoesterase [Pontivivens ytuae]